MQFEQFKGAVEIENGSKSVSVRMLDGQIYEITVRKTGEEQTCRKCGCTNYDCSECAERTGDACSWVEADLCSACVEEE
jgi:hypothetical protein